MKRIVGLFLGRLVKLRYAFNPRVKIGKGFIANFRFRISGPGRVIIGDNVNVWAFCEKTEINTYSDKALVVIGNYCRLNGTMIHCRERVEFGECVAAGSCNLMDNDFHSLDWEVRRRKLIEGVAESGVRSAPIFVGDDVWLAGQSVVMKGVNIGATSIIGFRAVVTKDVPESGKVVGASARVL